MNVNISDLQCRLVHCRQLGLLTEHDVVILTGSLALLGLETEPDAEPISLPDAGQPVRSERNQACSRATGSWLSIG